MNSSPSLRERKRLRTQQDLYDTAVQLISERGYKNVTVDDICREAEVARATFFRYFKTKAGLMIEFDRRIVDSIEIALSKQPMTATDQLYLVQGAMANAWRDVHPNLRALGMDYLKTTPVSEMSVVVAGIHEITTRIIRSGIEAGEFQLPLEPETAAEVFVSGIRIGIYHATTSGDGATLAERTRPVAEWLIGGLSAGLMTR